MIDDEDESPRRGSRPLTSDEILVRDAHWPGFNFGKGGWPDPDMLRGNLADWNAAGRPLQDDGTACACPLDAAWRCACPDTCPRCERRYGLGPFGRHRYDDSTCPTPGACTCPDLTGDEMAALADADRDARPRQGVLFP